MPSASRPTITAIQLPELASAAVAAQAIDEKASAKVAMRDDVWRRRKWLRLACVRNQNWIAVADAAAMATKQAVTSASSGEMIASASTNGTNTSATAESTASILARTIQPGRAGEVATRSGASSPEIASHASPPASWPPAITSSGTSTTDRP